MNKKLLVTCGCSFTYGNSGEYRYIPYGNLLSKKLNFEYINFSRPGASNYFISKQVEYSLNFNPDLVCIGVTTPLRFDYLENIESIYKEVTYNDFNISLDNQKGNKIESRSILWFNNESKNISNSKKKIKTNLEILDFLTTKTNYFIKKDQDKFIILGSCFKLIKKNIPYVILDFNKIFENNDNNVIDLDYNELRNKFPSQYDQYHFNQSGHFFIKDKIIDFLKLNYSFLL